jgi:anti-sigma28 factor (negative regulator of flagellin synthesis)
VARAWQQTPEVRPEKVARAKALIEDGSYPRANVIASIASLMAERL